jgi:hypothetical protein
VKTWQPSEDVAYSDFTSVHGVDFYRRMPYLAFLVVAAAEVAAIGFMNHGSLTYTLDDAYIHLALAERIGSGTYGINAGEFAAPASSILWPFILSLFSKTGFFPLVPCVLNLAAALGTLMVMARTARAAIQSDSRGISAPWMAALIILLIPAANLIPLAFTGMEHSVQQLLAVMIVGGLIDESKTERAPPYLWVSIALIPLVRYDSLALAVPALIYLSQRRHWRGSLLAAAVLVLALGAFSWFLKSHGLGFLPTSVMAKSDLMRTAGSIRALVLGVYGNLVQSPQGNFLLLVAVLSIAAMLDRRRPLQDRGLAATISTALLLHLVFGRVGAYFRYEAYLWAATVLMLIHLHRDWLSAALRAGRGFSARVAALGPLAAASIGYSFALISTPLASNNIYDQQYQMHRFVVDLYKGPVAVNDLGWVSFQNPRYVLDFWGLGSAEAQRARLSDPSGDWMDRLCREHGVDLIVIYDDWFPNHPSEWIRLGKLKLLRPKITPSGTEVAFYARDNMAAARARLALNSFSKSLPDGADFIPFTGQPGGGGQP